MTTGLDVFDHTVQVTNTWLNKIERDPAIGENRRRSYLALRTTLHAIRDELNVEETAQFAAQLPMLVRGFFYEGWDPSKVPVEDRDREAFLRRIAEPFNPVGMIDAERAVRTVLRVLNEELDPGELIQVRNLLRKPVRDLWPPPVAGTEQTQAGAEALGY